MPTETIDNKVDGKLKKAGKIFLVVFGTSVVFGPCFISHKVENTAVVEKRSYDLEVPEPDKGDYHEEQNYIRIDKHNKCLRAPKPFAEDLKEGDRLEYISWRNGFFGQCDYVTDYKLDHNNK